MAVHREKRAYAPEPGEPLVQRGERRNRVCGNLVNHHVHAEVEAHRAWSGFGAELGEHGVETRRV
jgi:hypothetical protein